MKTIKEILTIITINLEDGCKRERTEILLIIKNIKN